MNVCVFLHVTSEERGRLVVHVYINFVTAAYDT